MESRLINLVKKGKDKVVNFVRENKDYSQAALAYGLAGLMDTITTHDFATKMGTWAEGNMRTRYLMDNLGIVQGLTVDTVVPTATILVGSYLLNEYSRNKHNMPIEIGNAAMCVFAASHVFAATQNIIQTYNFF